jgi:hypothetical protein
MLTLQRHRACPGMCDERNIIGPQAPQQETQAGHALLCYRAVVNVKSTLNRNRRVPVSEYRYRLKGLA